MKGTGDLRRRRKRCELVAQEGKQVDDPGRTSAKDHNSVATDNSEMVSTALHHRDAGPAWPRRQTYITQM